jgi:hypothetical protein
MADSAESANAALDQDPELTPMRIPKTATRFKPKSDRRL